MRKSFRALPSHVLGAGKYSSGHYIVVVYWSKQFPSCEGNSERAETTGIKPFFTSPLHRCCCKMNGQAVVGKPHYQRVIWIVVRKIVSTWPIHWEKGMQDGWLRRGLCCSYTFVPSLPFFFIRHTRTRWRNVMEKPFECIMCTANGLQHAVKKTFMNIPLSFVEFKMNEFE